MKKLLPIGSVVQLSGGTKKIMVTGYSSKAQEDGKVFDYNGCIFPEGIMEEIYCLFDEDQIENIYFRGLETNESDKYLNKINSMVGSNISTPKEEKKSNNQTDQTGRRRTPKAPTKPMSSSEMKSRYGIIKSSKDTVK